MAARQEAEAEGLPDLDEARSRPQHEPRAIPPIPSRRRRCPPHNRRCNDDIDGRALPASTPAPPGKSAQADDGAGLIASAAGPTFLTLLTAALGDARPAVDVPLLDFYSGGSYSVSDSAPASPLSEPAGYAAAPALPFVQAQPTPQPFVTNTSLGAMRSDAPGWAGFQITTGSQPLTLTALGRLCSPGNSLLHELHVVRASDNVVMAATGVSMSGCAVNQFKYEDLPTPVTLSANTAYVVVSYEPGGDLFHDWTNSWLTTTADATINGAVYTINGGQTWSLATGNGNSYVPVDFKYTPGLPSVGFVTGRTSGAMRADSPGWAGFKMTTASQPVTVTSLGRLCLPNNSLSHELKIVRVSDNVTLAATTVPMSGCTSGQFKYAQLASSATLAANTSYVVVSYEVGGDLFYDWTGQWLTTSSVATVNGAIYTINGGQTWSLATGSGNSYVPVDFKYQTSEQALGTGLTAKYYDNLDFTTYKFTRVDPTINIDWGANPPSGSMGADQFSVRWAGMVAPRYSQTYTFYATTDDGVRVWVDGQLIIDKWVDQGPTTWSAQLPLDAGRQYDIRMEFYDNFGGAQARLEWQSASQAREVIPQSRLYPCWKNVADFVKEFFQAALARQPSSAELQDWSGKLAQAQGEAQLIEEARLLGIALFDLSPSSAYTARGRSDGDFVADLYRGFLQRDPDQSGWNFWLGQLQSQGRANIREAFAQSPEFREKVIRLCDTSAAADVNAGTGYNFATARLDPNNRTGGGGVDPYSRNSNFQIPILSLPGRAGLDLGLALSYNSLVWTKDAAGITFDADNGFPGPGFRLGFPTIQPKFVNPQLQQAGQPTRYSYLLITPSGARIELRQTATAGVYESADSSYLQLTEGGGAPQTLTTTDGTQMSFSLINGEYRCYQVKDGDGNFISVAYYGDGRVDRVTDTLGRTITFIYDSFQNLIRIEQPWRRDTEANPNPTQDETHRWASFGYANVTLQPSFSNLAVMGDQPGAVIPALTQVGLDDGSYYVFAYNRWGQVWKVTHYAADAVDAQHNPTFTHALSHTRLDLPGSDLAGATPQTNCPRFTQQRTWVEYGLMNQSGEVTTSYDPWSPSMGSCEVTLPDGTTKQISSYGTSAEGWKKGLTTSQEVRSSGQPVKTTTLSWEHDGSVTAPYPTNPRVTQTTVSDPQGHGRTTRVTYTIAADFQGGGYNGTLNVSLPKKVEECDAGCASVLRTTVTDYKVANLTEYVARRILGLPNYEYTYNGVSSAGSLRSQVGYVYDEPNDAQDTFLTATATQASQHDGVNYGTGFRWRGNTNRVRRYSVDQQTGAVGPYVESRAAYNTTGTTAYAKDAAGHKTSLSYTDSFFQNVNRTATDPQLQLKTYAYPTTVTDPDNFTATSSYNYDMGVVRQTQTPLPNVTTNQPGPVSRVYYDEAGRAVKSLNVDTGAYKRVVYLDSMTLAQTYTLVDAAAESYSASVLDGAGRVRASASTLLLATGVYAYTGQLTDYDSMGRVARQSNPTATNASGSTWAATDDDAVSSGGTGWVYRLTTYDWKGRPKLVTNVDNTTREFDYGGCGCAGGEVVNTRDEAGRRQRVSYDTLGRVRKTQVLTQQPTKPQPFNPDPNEVAYSTVTNTYDALDRVTEARERAEASGVEQVTTMTYDGHGRLKSRHVPQQGAGVSTSYAYNPDDTPDTVTDGRGAVTTYSYNNSRHLLSGVTYTLAGCPTVAHTYTYDAAGNCKSASEGAGSGVTYQYDVLSRMTSETRTFAGLSNPNSPYTLNYTYNLAGQLKTLTDPFGAQFTYARDAAGRVTDVTGSSYAGVTSYVNSARYRAWGGLKSASFGDLSSQTTKYDARMRPSQYRLTGGGTGGLREDFSYYDDSRLHLITDLDDGTRQPSPQHLTMSRTYSYDLVGRVTDAGGISSPSPYHQNYDYDAFNNLKYRSGAYGYQPGQTDTPTFTNNRRDGWQYDADGRLVSNPASFVNNARTWQYDAAGKLVTTTETSSTNVVTTLTDAYDTDGRIIYNSTGNPATTFYMVRSTVLGGEVVTRLTSAGAKSYTYVPVGGLVQARQTVNTSSQQVMEWSHTDAVGVTEQGTNGLAGYDPLGNYAPLPPPPPSGGQTQSYAVFAPAYNWSPSSFTNFNNASTGCMLDGRPESCDRVLHYMVDGWSVQHVPLAPPGVNIVFDPMPMAGPNGGGMAAYYVPGGRRVAGHSGDGGVRTEPDGTEVVVTNRGETGGYWTLAPSGSIGEVASVGPLFVPAADNGSTAKFLDEGTFANCLQTLYRVGDWFGSSNPDDMYFTGVYKPDKNWFQRNIYDYNNSVNIDIRTSTELSGRDLQFMVGGTKGTGNFVWGATDPSKPNKNWVASEAVMKNQVFLQSLWVYELGNALHAITGLVSTDDIQDPERYGVLHPKDVGGKLVDCVYGGRVTEHGTVQRPR